MKKIASNNCRSVQSESVVFDPSESDSVFGFISGVPLPAVPCFSVFQEQEEFDISIRNTEHSQNLSEKDFCLIQLFHRHVFEDILPVHKNIEFMPNFAHIPLLLAPLKRIGKLSDYELDYKCLSPDIRQPPTKLSDEVRQQFRYDESKFVNAVVMPWYRNDHKYAHCFLVNKICRDLTPLSGFPNPEFSSYGQYYAQKYGLQIFHRQQSLIQVRQLTLMNDFFSLIPKKLVMGDESARESTKNYVVPELLQIHLFTATQWMALYAIPAVFYSLAVIKLLCNYLTNCFGLESLLLADEFRCKIMTEAFGVTAKPPDQFKWDRLQYTIENKSDDDKAMFSFEQEGTLNKTVYGVQPALLLQALTPASANDGINLERFETIGDSFLKFAITNILYKSMADQDEGKLTSARMKLICNSHLIQIAKNRRIPFLVEVSRFDPCNWLPPCYTSDVLSRLQSQPFLREKYLADVVEALIGVHVVSLGYRKALMFMKWLGFDVCPQSAGCLSYSLDLVHLKADKEQMIALRCEQMRLSKVEDILGYTFREKRHLLQAFTHPFCIEKLTESYQRLEFLGDAVLDYLMMRYFFEHPKNFNPATLTDLRTALVNNTILASLVVKMDLHMYVSFPPALSAIFSKFVTLCRENPIRCVNFDLVYDQKLSDDCGSNFEPPKVLADVFESLVGAVFLDCNMDLAIVWRILYKMMKEIIQECCRKPPQSPVVELCTMFPLEKVVVKKEIRSLPTDMASVTISVKGSSFDGIARNYALAKVVAAKRAINHFRGTPGRVD